MDIRLLGTGSPIPLTNRGGTSVLLSVANEPILVDCGPLTVHRMLEYGNDPSAVETLFLTHHHIDHTADFFQFVIASWTLGRESLTIYGPKGTDEFIETLYALYEEDIAYRKWFGHGTGGIKNVKVVRTTGNLSVSTERWSATALPVEHSIETYAYRFTDERTGESCVISGDTRRIDDLAEFAADADVLIQDCCIAPFDTNRPASEQVPDRLTGPMSDDMRRKHKRNHCNPEDAGKHAEKAGVDTLVLTHLLPHRDHAAMRERAETVFDGKVLVAEDGMRLSV